jgi:L-threonylcarbamoyladenylate synthase
VKTQDYLQQAILSLRQGGVIAYPTEAVYGLGCDPFQKNAVAKLLRLKHRAASKGLIIIGSDWQQLAPLVAEIPEERLQVILQSWPGPVTWVFPINATTPAWLHGDYHSLALRVTDHPIAKALCQAFANPLVSTSANRSGEMPARDALMVKQIFADTLDYIVEGKVGSLAKPTVMRDALTGKILRG